MTYETHFLRRYDEFRRRIEVMIDMPQRTINILFRFLDQSQGWLSKGARDKEFAALTDDEARRIEEAYGDIFADHTDQDVEASDGNGLG